jgi:hypothetical protein
MDMKKIILMALVVGAALLLIWNSETSFAQGKDCRPGIVHGIGEGLSEGLARHSCRIRYKKAVVKKYGGNYAHFEFGVGHKMECGRLEGKKTFVCQCSAQPCR